MKKKIIGSIIGLIIVSWVIGYASISSAASDWKKCPAKVVFINTKDVKMVYRLLWLDHDIEEWKGRPSERAGGEIAKFYYDEAENDFRLCPGRHVMFWTKIDNKTRTWKKYKAYVFIVTKEMKHLAIAPDTVKCKEVSEVPFKVLWPEK